MTNIITNAMDYQTAEHWCNAVGMPAYPTIVLDRGNVYQYALDQDLWFTPDYDENGEVIDNDRLEQFRLACLYDCLSNILDVGENLDDEIEPSLVWMRLLVQHAGTGQPSTLEWMTFETYSIVLRTLRLRNA